MENVAMDQNSAVQIAHLHETEGLAIWFGSDQHLEVWNQRRLARAHINPDGAALFLYRTRRQMHGVAELAGFRRLAGTLPFMTNSCFIIPTDVTVV